MIISGKVCFIESLYEALIKQTIKWKQIGNQLSFYLTDEYLNYNKTATEIIEKTEYIPPLKVNKDNTIERLSHEELHNIQINHELSKRGTFKGV